MPNKTSQKHTTGRKKTAQKKNNNNVALFWISFTVIVLSWLAIDLYRKNRPSDEDYMSFNSFYIDMPDGYDIHGIDISHNQSHIPWQTVKTFSDKGVKISFIFIKATEGNTYVDNKFQQNWEKAAQYQITRGAYHYFMASKNGVDQANNFVRQVTLRPGDLPPVVDIEKLGSATPGQMRQNLNTFLTLLENNYGVRPIIYTYVHFYNNYLGHDYDDYPLWIAHYKQKNKPRIDRSWMFWQHNERGRMPKSRDHFDFDVFNGDQSDFDNLKIK